VCEDSSKTVIVLASLKVERNNDGSKNCRYIGCMTTMVKNIVIEIRLNAKTNTKQ